MDWKLLDKRNLKPGDLFNFSFSLQLAFVGKHPVFPIESSWGTSSGADSVTNFLNFWASYAEITFLLLKSFCFLKLSNSSVSHQGVRTARRG